MTFRREPSTVWEEKVDFAKISRMQTSRQERLLDDLRKLLKQIERDTLVWVNRNLVQKKLKTAIQKFELPRAARYRAILRTRLTSAAIRGVADVAAEVGQPKPKMKTADLTRIRARADALYEEHRGRLEADLKREWSQAMFGIVSKTQLEYVTRLAFARFAGWEEPDGP